MKNIYFMRRADGVGPIKIGCSAWPAQRLKAMQVWCPHPLEVAVMVPGGFADEKRLHNQFHAHRLHGEWFEPAPALLALVARCAATGALPPPSPDDRVVRIVAAFRGGKIMREIAEEFGITRQRVEQILRKAGVEHCGKSRGAHRKVPAWTRLEELRSLASQGLTANQIATAIGDNYVNVSRVARISGIKITRAAKGYSDKTIETAFKVAEQYKAGRLTREIAAGLGIQTPHVFRFLRIAGVKPKRQGPHAEAHLPTADVIAAYECGATLKDIAQQHGVRPNAVKRIIKVHGRLRSHQENEAIRKAAVSRANHRRRAA